MRVCKRDAKRLRRKQSCKRSMAIQWMCSRESAWKSMHETARRFCKAQRGPFAWIDAFTNEKEKKDDSTVTLAAHCERYHTFFHSVFRWMFIIYNVFLCTSCNGFCILFFIFDCAISFALIRRRSAWQHKLHIKKEKGGARISKRNQKENSF